MLVEYIFVAKIQQSRLSDYWSKMAKDAFLTLLWSNKMLKPEFYKSNLKAHSVKIRIIKHFSY